jgi:hypothetical protein
VKVRQATLISVDGVSGTAVEAAGRAALVTAVRARRGGISTWDASGLFQDLAVADGEAGAPSARTLLLLYAADLASRLRWEIRPALAEGRLVVAAPYVDTAIALGRAAGLRSGWLTNLFGFAPPADESRYVDVLPLPGAAGDAGLLEFAWEQEVRMIVVGLSREQLFERARGQLRMLAQRAGRRASASTARTAAATPGSRTPRRSEPGSGPGLPRVP